MHTGRPPPDIPTPSCPLSVASGGRTPSCPLSVASPSCRRRSRRCPSSRLSSRSRPRARSSRSPRSPRPRPPESHRSHQSAYLLITFSARRALAAGIRRSTCSGAEAAYVERCDDQPAPDPACCFDCPADPAPAESDLLRVAAWVAVGLFLGSALACFSGKVMVYYMKS